jgi:hypothetical protein
VVEEAENQITRSRVMWGSESWCCLLENFIYFGGRRLTTLLSFMYVTGDAGRKCVRYMPWPQVAECNMIRNPQTGRERRYYTKCDASDTANHQHPCSK